MEITLMAVGILYVPQIVYYYSLLFKIDKQPLVVLKHWQYRTASGKKSQLHRAPPNTKYHMSKSSNEPY